MMQENELARFSSLESLDDIPMEMNDGAGKLKDENICCFGTDTPIDVHYVNEVFLVFSKESAIRILKQRVLDADSYDGSLFGIEEEQVTSSLPTEEELDFARTAAQGKKAKERKRREIGDKGDAKMLRVRKSDKKGIEVTEEEIAAALQGIRANKRKKEDLIHLRSTLPDSFYDVITTPELTDTSEFRAKELVYLDLWRKGYFLTTGAKFGCDYLCYPDDPELVHSGQMVIVLKSSQNLSPLRMISLSRTATQVKKKIVFGIVSPEDLKPYYVQMDWFRALGTDRIAKAEGFQAPLFFSFFKSLVGKDVVVELKNDLSISGTLQSVDQYLNMKLHDITVLEPERFPHMLSVKNCFIRGSVVRYVQLPADQVDTQLLQEASRKEIAANKK